MKQWYALYVLLCSWVFLLSLAGPIPRFQEDALVNLSKFELSQLHTRTSKVSHDIRMLAMSDSNWRKAVVSPII